MRRPLIWARSGTRHRRIHIDAGGKKRAHCVETALTHGKEERRKAGISVALISAPASISSPDDSGVPLGRRPHQGRLAVPLARLVFGAAREERLHRLHISGARSQHEDGFSAIHRGVRVRSSFQQQLHDCGVAVRTCQRQRRHAIAVHCVDIGLRSQEQRNSLGIIVICGPVQRSGPINLGGVHIDARLQERADAGLIASFRGIGECRTFRRKCGDGEGERQKR